MHDLLTTYIMSVAKLHRTSLRQMSLKVHKSESYFNTMSSSPTPAKLTEFSKLSGVPVNALQQVLHSDRRPVAKLLKNALSRVTDLKQFQKFLLLIIQASGGFRHLTLKYTHGKTSYLSIQSDLYSPVMSKAHFVKMSKGVHELTGYPLRSLLDKLNNITSSEVTVSGSVRKLAVEYLESYRVYYYSERKCSIPRKSIMSGSDRYAYRTLHRIADTLQVPSSKWYGIMSGDTKLLFELRHYAMQEITDLASLKRYLRTILAVCQNVKGLASSYNQYQRFSNALSRSHSVSSKRKWAKIIEDVGRWMKCPMGPVLEKLKHLKLDAYGRISMTRENAIALNRYVRSIKNYRLSHHQIETTPDIEQIYFDSGCITEYHLKRIAKAYAIPMLNLRMITQGQGWPQRHFLTNLAQQIKDKAALKEYFRTVISMYGNTMLKKKHKDKYNFLMNVIYHDASLRTSYIRATKTLCYAYGQPSKPVLSRIKLHKIGKDSRPKIAKVSNKKIHLANMAPVRNPHITMVYRRQVLYFIRAAIQLWHLHLSVVPKEMTHGFLTMPDNQLLMALQFYGEAIHISATTLATVACDDSVKHQSIFLKRASNLIYDRKTLYNFLCAWLKLNGTTVTKLLQQLHVSPGYLASTVLQASGPAMTLHRVINKINKLVTYTWPKFEQDKVFKRLKL